MIEEEKRCARRDTDKTDFCQYGGNWQNRMVLGDSLQVKVSLAEREGLRGKDQCIYLCSNSTGRW